MVNHKILMPQEIEVMYVLPTIRKYFALYMKEMGLSQKEIAKRLHLRESTVSQYISEKRGNIIKFNDEIEQKLREAVKRIQTKHDLIRETQHMLKEIRKTNILCQIHRQFSDLPIGCSMENMGCC